MAAEERLTPLLTRSEMSFETGRSSSVEAAPDCRPRGRPLSRLSRGPRSHTPFESESVGSWSN